MFIRPSRSACAAIKLLTPPHSFLRTTTPFAQRQNMSSNAFAYIVQPSDISPNSSEGDKLWSTALTAASKKALDTRILYKDESVTSLVSVGKEFAAKDENARRELVRKAAGKAVGQVKDAVGSGLEVKDVVVDDGGLDAHAAGTFVDRHTGDTD